MKSAIRRLLRCLAAATVVLASGGCLTAETLIRLNADRSGTLEQTILLNTKTLDALPALMAGMFGGDAKVTPSSKPSIAVDDMFDATKLGADASRFGKGVRFVSVEKRNRGPLQGATVTYAFDDINAIEVERDAPNGALGFGDLAVAGGAAAADDALGFAVETLPNGHTRLTIRFDEPEGAKAGAPAPKAPGGAAPAGVEDLVRQMFDGFRIAIAVEVNGAIVHSSSPHVDGSRVTVFDMDLGALVADKEGLKRLETVPPGASVAEMMPLLKDVPAIKISASPLVVEFSTR